MMKMHHPQLGIAEVSEPRLGGFGAPEKGGDRKHPLPLNAKRVVADIAQRGVDVIDPLIVSFVGWTKFSNPHVFPLSGIAYDWKWTRGLETRIFTRPGIDCQLTMARIFMQSDLRKGYPALIDVERRTVGYIVGVHPIRLMRVKEGGAAWNAYFA